MIRRTAPLDRSGSALASDAIRVARPRNSNEHFLCPMAVILPVITASIKPGAIHSELERGTRPDATPTAAHRQWLNTRQPQTHTTLRNKINRR